MQIKINFRRKFRAEKDFTSWATSAGSPIRVPSFFFQLIKLVIKEDQQRNQDQSNKIFGVLKMQLLIINYQLLIIDC